MEQRPLYLPFIDIGFGRKFIDVGQEIGLRICRKKSFRRFRPFVWFAKLVEMNEGLPFPRIFYFVEHRNDLIAARLEGSFEILAGEGRRQRRQQQNDGGAHPAAC